MTFYDQLSHTICIDIAVPEGGTASLGLTRIHIGALWAGDIDSIIVMRG